MLVVAASCGGRADVRSARAYGLVEVEQRFTESRGVYIEGAYSYVALTTPEGEPVGEERRYPEDGYRTTFRLDAGRYRAESWQRPCSAYCSANTLGPPVDRCSAEFEIEPGEAIRLRIEVRRAEGCDIEVE